MAYTIYKTDGTVLLTLGDGKIDQKNTSLTLIGKNVPSYGEYFNNDLVALLENFASVDEPVSPLVGQLWYDLNTGRLKVYDQNSIFRSVSNLLIADTRPVELAEGDFWYDITNKQLFVCTNGGVLNLVGPTDPAAYGRTGWRTEVLSDGSYDHVVLSLYNDDQLLAVLSGDNTFTIENSTSSFTTIQPGLNLSPAGNLKFIGTATSAESINGLDSSKFIRNDINQTTTGSFIVKNNLGLTVANANNENIGIYVNTGTHEGTIAYNSVDKNFRIQVANSTTGLTSTIYVNSFNRNLGIWNTNPQYPLDVLGDTRIRGNLYVVGTTTNISAVNMQVYDKNIELGYGQVSPNDTYANGGGLTLYGTNNHSITWKNNGSGWNFNDTVNLYVDTKTYTGVALFSSTGTGATFDVVNTDGVYSVSLSNAGSNYVESFHETWSTSTPFITWTTSTPWVDHWTTSTPFNFSWTTSTPYITWTTASTRLVEWTTSTPYITWTTASTRLVEWTTSTPFVEWTTSTPHLFSWTTSTPFITWNTTTPYITEWTTSTPYILEWTTGTSTYTSLTVDATSNTGTGAIFDVQINPDLTYALNFIDGGINYAATDTISYYGTSLGGTTPANDLIINVDSVDAGTGAIITYSINSGVATWTTSTPIVIEAWTTSTPYIDEWSTTTQWVNFWTTSTPVVLDTWSTTTPYVHYWTTSTPAVIDEWNTTTPWVNFWTTSTPAVIDEWNTTTPWVNFWTTSTPAVIDEWNTTTPWVNFWTTSTPVAISAWSTTTPYITWTTSTPWVNHWTTLTSLESVIELGGLARIYGSDLGGDHTANDILIDITNVDAGTGAIIAFTFTGIAATLGYQISSSTVITKNSLGNVITSAPGLTSVGTLDYLTVTNVLISGNTVETLDTDQTLYLNASGSGTIDASNNRITSIATPSDDTDAATKKYVDDSVFLVGTKAFALSLDITNFANTTTDVKVYLDQMFPIYNPGEPQYDIPTGVRAKVLCSSRVINTPITNVAANVAVEYVDKTVDGNLTTATVASGLAGAIVTPIPAMTATTTVIHYVQTWKTELVGTLTEWTPHF